MSSLPIEDYAMIGDTESVALVGKNGSIDWLPLPRFDSPAVFAALLGDEENGRWLLAPQAEPQKVTRRYRGCSLILETVFECDGGEVALVDFMTPRDERPNLFRIVEGRRGRVEMTMDLRIRFGYGDIVPWVRRVDGRLIAVAGPDGLQFVTPIDTHGEDMSTRATFSVGEGDKVPFQMQWFPPHQEPELPLEPFTALLMAQRSWDDWMASCTYDGEWEQDVRSSLAVLKGLTYAPTGGLVAAATTSLPEDIGGERNWDYRYCWLRDATFSLIALLAAGFKEEAMAFRDWLLRAAAGDPSELQIMYGPAGERRLTELELDWLSGYEGSRPVRIGNGAVTQFQLDVYGEVMDVAHVSRNAKLPADLSWWDLQRELLDFLEGAWREPDEGIWEVRGPRRHFTHSKVMAWVAMDRACQAVDRFEREGNGRIDGWRQTREEIRREVLEKGVDERGVFVQHYDTTELDASLLMIPLVGFLPATDERVANTVDAIQRELMENGYVRRYRRVDGFDGLEGSEGAFLLCTFWLADNLHLLGRDDEATQLYERLLGLRNDVGLLSEEVDPRTGRFLGNFPQAFSHVALINTAMNLCRTSRGPAARRAGHWLDPR